MAGFSQRISWGRQSQLRGGGLAHGLLTYLPAFIFAGIACIVAAVLVLGGKARIRHCAKAGGGLSRSENLASVCSLNQ